MGKVYVSSTIEWFTFNCSEPSFIDGYGFTSKKWDISEKACEKYIFFIDEKHGQVIYRIQGVVYKLWFNAFPVKYVWILLCICVWEYEWEKMSIRRRRKEVKQI